LVLKSYARKARNKALLYKAPVTPYIRATFSPRKGLRIGVAYYVKFLDFTRWACD
jgi:hypothetical protein